jgi:arylsulfatase A-like enzyme
LLSKLSHNNNLLSNPDALTPHIDSLRTGGKAFTQFYSASAVCSPTRAAVLTGMMPMRFGMEDVWPQDNTVIPSSAGLSGLPSSIPQLGRLMQAAGFATAHHGKWHVGLSRPIYGHQALGFTDFSYFRLPEGEAFEGWHGRFSFFADEGVKEVDVDYVDTYFADQVIAFIQEQAAKQQRFYVNYWPLSPHTPWSLPRNFDNSETQFDLTTDRGKVLAMMYAVDQEIGRIVDALEQLGIVDETLIIVTSDNGGQQKVQNADRYFRGNKGALFEGGIRVPFVANWPAGIPANSTSDQVMTSADLLPTFLALVGVDVAPIEKQIDGRSMVGAFLTGMVVPHAPILWELSGNPKKTKDIRAQDTYAMRDGDYMLIKAENRHDQTNPKAYFLYNMAKDPQQTKNLVARDPKRLAELREKLLTMRKEVSQFNAFPQSTVTRTILPFDPRVDVTSRDMTLIMKVTVPDALDSAKNLYLRPNSFRITLAADQTVQWEITGSNSSNQKIFENLKSAPLAPGEHELIFAIQCFKSDTLRAELFVDGHLVDATYPDGKESEILVVWSSILDATIGDNGITLQDIRYYNNHFWLDELASGQKVE